MLFVISFACMVAVAYSATTMPASTAAPAVVKILYDMQHHKAIIVRSDGCFEYHMNHQEVLDAQDATAKPLLEATMVKKLSTATVHEMGHHHIDHMTSEIKTTCASIPVFSFESHPQ